MSPLNDVISYLVGTLASYSMFMKGYVFHVMLILELARQYYFFSNRVKVLTILKWIVCIGQRYRKVCLV